jgi:hypothetical protein
LAGHVKLATQIGFSFCNNLITLHISSIFTSVCLKSPK